jgi:hypothetical protein
MMSFDEQEMRQLFSDLLNPLVEKLQEQTNQIVALSSVFTDLTEQNCSLSVKFSDLISNQGGLLAHSLNEAGPSIPAITTDPAFNSDLYATVVKRPGKHRQLPLTASLELQNRFEILGLMTEVSQRQEKALNAVLVNCPELGSNDVETDKIDRAMVEEIFLQAKLPVARIKKIAHHGRKRENKPRVLKVYTDNKQIRNKLIQEYSKFRVAQAPRSFCRRDLTVTKLKMDGATRREAYARNSELGQRKWTVRDLRLIELPSPYHPFGAPDNHNQLNSSRLDPDINTSLSEDLQTRPRQSFLRRPSETSLPDTKRRPGVYGCQQGVLSPYAKKPNDTFVNDLRRKSKQKSQT